MIYQVYTWYTLPVPGPSMIHAVPYHQHHLPWKSFWSNTVCRCFVPGPQVPPDGLLPSQAVQDSLFLLAHLEQLHVPKFDGTPVGNYQSFEWLYNFKRKIGERQDGKLLLFELSSGHLKRWFRIWESSQNGLRVSYPDLYAGMLAHQQWPSRGLHRSQKSMKILWTFTCHCKWIPDNPNVLQTYRYIHTLYIHVYIL